MKRFHFSMFIAAAACLAILTACGTSGAPREFTTKIRGTVVDRPKSHTLILSRIYEDMRVSAIEIPIVDGRFEYDLTTDTREMWTLAFMDEVENGSWMPYYFFSEPGTVSPTLYPGDRWEEYTLKGGKLNAEFAAMADSMALWWRLRDQAEAKLEERGFVPVYRMVSMNPETGKSEMKEVNENLETAEGRALYAEYLAMVEQTTGREKELVGGRPSEVKLAMLYQNIRSGLDLGDADEYIDIYNEAGYAEKYPDSPYTRELANLLGAVGNLKVGGRYIDFTLPDLDDAEITVSEYIAGKVALIDLWMTWCGPCRRGAMDAIPVYEEFKGKGFTVIGANGDGDLEGIKAAAAKDGYPWPTLVDLKGAAGLWSKYGIGGSGGSSYLVDRDGTILAVNPGTAQLRSILAEKLSE